MKRILQLLSGIMMALALTLGWRTLNVARIELPVFADPPQVSLKGHLPPAPRKSTGTAGVVRVIIGGNLFETERGQKPKTEDKAEMQAPLPPPTNIVLNGIFLLPDEPVAIMSDKKSGAKQRGLRRGEMIGDYEIGDIASRKVTLLGAGGQRFTVRLETRKGAGTAAPASTRGTRPTPPRPPAARAPRPPVPERGTATTRAQPSRPSTGRERSAPVARPAKPAARPDPAQARLEALKKLREAANRR